MDDRVVKSVEEMNVVAAELVNQLQPGQVLLLYGELGAGKTTFVQGLGKALGITESVTSPTFVIASEYAVTNHPSITTLAHVDLYRLEENQASKDPAVRDILDRATDPGRLTVIEWADRLGTMEVPGARTIHFKHSQEPSERLVTLGALSGIG